MEEKLKIVKKIATKLLKLLVVEAKIEVTEDKEAQAIKVQINSEESGVLIGFHGETLASFQLLLSIIAGREMGDWTRIMVNVGDYREKREEVLRHMGLNAAQKVRFSGEPVSLPGLSAADRRVIHLVLSEYNDIVAESEGEGRDRMLVIKPQKTG
jgi:spoIIIJ-associated protein